MAYLPTLADQYDRSAAGLKIHAFLIKLIGFGYRLLSAVPFGQVAISSTVGKTSILDKS